MRTIWGRNWWVRFSVFVLALAAAGLQLLSLAKTPVGARFNLGLDLQGGASMVLGLDYPKHFRQLLDRVRLDVVDQVKLIDPACRVADVEGEIFGIRCDSPQSRAKTLEVLFRQFSQMKITEGVELSVEFSRLYKDAERERALAQSIEVLQNRADEFGVVAPVIRRSGSGRITVELPGVTDLAQARELVGRLAQLEFRSVDNEKLSSDDVLALVSEIEAKNSIRFREGDRFSEYVAKVNQIAKEKLPAQTMIAFQRESTVAGNLGRTAYLLNNRVELSGAEVRAVNFFVDRGSLSAKVVVDLTDKGVEQFKTWFEKSKGHEMVIMLDGIIHAVFSVPTLPVGHSIEIPVLQKDMASSQRIAQELVTVVRAGSPAVALEVQEQRVVAPRLGADMIRRSRTAVTIALGSLLLLLLIYYRLSGVVAGLTLLVNFVFLGSALVALGIPISLTSLLAVVLTFGLTVDNIIVVYERIREELRTGKIPKIAVMIGFEKSFRAIVDAQVATAIAASVLIAFTSGYLRVFAITMVIGTATTFLSVVLFSRLVFDWYLDRFYVKELSI